MVTPARATPDRRTPAPYPPWWVIFAAWTAWGLLWSAAVTVASRLGGKPMTFDTALRIQMPLALVWALLTPGIVWLGRRIPPFGTRRWPLGVAVNLIASMVVVFGTGVFFVLNNRWVQGPPPDAPPLMIAALRTFAYWLSSDGLLYWAILAIDFGVRDYSATPGRTAGSTPSVVGRPAGPIRSPCWKGLGIPRPSLSRFSPISRTS